MKNKIVKNIRLIVVVFLLVIVCLVWWTLDYDYNMSFSSFSIRYVTNEFSENENEIIVTPEKSDQNSIKAAFSSAKKTEPSCPYDSVSIICRSYFKPEQILYIASDGDNMFRKGNGDPYYYLSTEGFIAVTNIVIKYAPDWILPQLHELWGAHADI
jgi:hypothetical protein